MAVVDGILPFAGWNKGFLDKRKCNKVEKCEIGEVCYLDLNKICRNSLEFSN